MLWGVCMFVEGQFGGNTVMKNNNQQNWQNDQEKGIRPFVLFTIIIVLVIAFMFICNNYYTSKQKQEQASHDADQASAPAQADSISATSTVYVGVEPTMARQQTFVQPTNDTNKLAQIAADQRISAEKTLAAFRPATDLNRTQAVVPGK